LSKLDFKALILAGGVGSRFHPYTEIVPKPMIPIGEKEKPVLEVIVKWIKHFGIREFVFLVDYKWKYIYNYFENGSRFGVKIEYSFDEQDGYRGTGGAILKAYRKGLMGNRALIWYGDILAPLNVEELINFHDDRKADLTLVVTKKYKVPVGVAKLIEDNRVVEMVEKPVLDINATIGVSVVDSRVFSEPVEDVLGKSFDFMGDMVPWLIRRGYRVYGYIYTGDWYDVGSLERYKKISSEELDVFNNVL